MENNFDWLRIFFTKPILVVLSKYLSFVDIIHLSCTCKQMYDPWINDSERVRALDLHKRIKSFTGRRYKRHAPLKYLRVAALNALEPIPHTTTFRCFRCNQTRSIYPANRNIFKYVTCYVCVKKWDLRKDFFFNYTEARNYYLEMCGLEWDKLSLRDQQRIYDILLKSTMNLYEGASFYVYSKDVLNKNK